ncbi:MAG: O-antigen ligase family protein [Acidimicrobiia bacterium]
MMTNVAFVSLIAQVASTSWLVIAITVAAFIGAVAVALRPAVSPHLATLRSSPLLVPDERYLKPEPPQMRRLEKALLVVLAGYMLFDHAFAWVHVPGTPLFVGEAVIALGIWVILSARSGFGSITHGTAGLRALRNFMLWGLLLLLLAIIPWGLDAVRDSAIWYYGITAFFVAMLLVSDPRRVGDWIVRYAKLLPIMLIWLPVATVLSSTAPKSIKVPDSNVSIFEHRNGNIAVLAAVAIAFLWLADGDSRLFTPRQRGGLTTLATLVIVFTGLQNRGGMVSSFVLIAVVMVMLSKHRLEMVVMMIAVLVFGGAIGIIFKVNIALFDERTISIEQFANNITSIIHPDEGGQRQTQTTEWRLNIWTQVLNDVSNESPIMGFGPGPDLGKRYGITTDDKTPLRNPHNSHVGVLARTGWLGLILWLILWITWMAEMQTLRRRLRYRDRPHESAIVGWIMVTPIPFLVNCIFDPTLEGAQVAMVMWAFYGAGAALVILAQQNRFPSLTALSLKTTPKRRVAVR